MLHRISRHIHRLLRWRSWEKQAKSLSQEYLSKTESAKLFEGKGTILVIAPHADDELIGCHQMISNHTSKVIIFYCSFLGSNPSDDNRRVRELEIRHYAREQQCDLLVSSPAQVEKELTETISKLKPTTVFLPSVVDWHPDHRRVNYIVKDVLSALDFQCDVMWYHVSLPIPALIVNRYSPMNKQQHCQKWQMMKHCYPSQLHMDIKRFRFVERALECESYAAETYLCLNVSQWAKVLDNPTNDIIDEKALKKTLGNIREMYIKTSEHYKKLSL